MLIIALLWTRSQVVGDTVQQSGVRTTGWTLMALGTVSIVAGGAVALVAALVLRGALDALFGAAGLMITGVISLISGAVLASVANRSTGGHGGPRS